MSISPDHLLKYVIEPTLDEMAEETGLELNTKPAKALILGTIAHESLGGFWLSQAPTGPARGIAQMEVETHDWLWSDYLARRHDLANAILRMVSRGGNTADRMVYDLRYAVAMARVYYWSKPDPIPDNLRGIAEYWKEHWNTKHGSGTTKEFMKNWNLWAKSAIGW